MTIFIPLGRNCLPTMILREAKLRKESLPFDWVLGTPENIKRSLDQNFVDWFDKNITNTKDSLYNINSVSEHTSTGTGSIHPLYPVSKDLEPNGAFFPHIDLTDAETIKTTKRRIDRFNKIISSDEDIIFFSSISHKDLEKYQLLNYFNRDAKTSFILLDWEKSDENVISATTIEGITVIVARFDDEWNTDYISKIADCLVSCIST